jgi:hypothetical protein
VLARDVLLRLVRQRHLPAPKFSVHRRPVRLGLPAMTPPGARTGSRAGEQPGLQLRIGDVVGQRPASLSVGIQVPFAKPKGGTVSEPEEASSPRATSFRNGGRHRAESTLAGLNTSPSLTWSHQLQPASTHL